MLEVFSEPTKVSIVLEELNGEKEERYIFRATLRLERTMVNGV